MEQIGFRILPRVATDAALVQLFAGLPASNIGDCLSRMDGTWGLNAYHRPGVQLLGSALTVRVRPGDNLMIHKALMMVQPGDVLVIDGGGDVSQALVGGLQPIYSNLTTAVAALPEDSLLRARLSQSCEQIVPPQP